VKLSLIHELGSTYILGDGAMGTELLKQGLPVGAPAELWNVDNPEAVAAVHRGYLEAGSQCLTTNTFGANRIRLQDRGLNGERAAELCAAGVRIAREVASENTWVLGSIGPCLPMSSEIEGNKDLVSGAFAEQAKAIAEAGIDAFILETQTHLAEAETAAGAIRSMAPGIPMIVTLSFLRGTGVGDYRLVRSGEDMSTALDRVIALKPDAIGANCGLNLDMSDYATILAAMRAKTNMPVIAQPNAGPAPACGSGTTCTLEPEAMADGVWGLVRAGANLIGGCCGTTPAHLELFRRELDQL